MATHNSLGSLFSDIADSIREKTGENKQFVADNFPAEIDAIPTGITPSGTLSITQNGTHDVTNYASAYVNIQSTNFKQWIYTSTGTATATTVTLVSGDDWIKRNYSNDNLVIVLKPKFIPQPGTDLRSIVYSMGSNSPFAYGWTTGASSAENAYITFSRFVNDTGSINSYSHPYKLMQTATSGNIGDLCVKYNGDIGLITGTGTDFMLQAGDWEITAYLMASHSYTNLADPTSTDWKNGYRWNSSCVEQAQAGLTESNFISIVQGDLIRVKGIDFTAAGSNSRLAICGNSAMSEAPFLTDYTTEFVGSTYKVNAEYDSTEGCWRFAVINTSTASGKLTRMRWYFPTPADASTIIITKNEPIG